MLHRYWLHIKDGVIFISKLLGCLATAAAWFLGLAATHEHFGGLGIGAYSAGTMALTALLASVVTFLDKEREREAKIAEEVTNKILRERMQEMQDREDVRTQAINSLAAKTKYPYGPPIR